MRRSAALASALNAQDQRLPTNRSEAEVVGALAEAHALYLDAVRKNEIADIGAAKGPASAAAGAASFPPAVVLMVVQPEERNFIDQRGIEVALWEAHRVPLIRATLLEIEKAGTLHGAERRLQLALQTGNVEVSVVYLRVGYTPTDYPGDAEWQGRALTERSFAIKCPSVDVQLAGTKKVQQVLSRAEELERFVSGEHAAMLRSCFAGLWGLQEGTEVTKDIVEMALAAPSNFVLKPQREGGGNNYFDQELADKLREMSPSERAAYIIMQRIEPPTHEAALMKAGEVEGGACACELGVYGVFLGDGRRVLLNKDAGHLLRVKRAGVAEGGVVAGFAALGSPVLYP